MVRRKIFFIGDIQFPEKHLDFKESLIINVCCQIILKQMSVIITAHDIDVSFILLIDLILLCFAAII